MALPKTDTFTAADGTVLSTYNAGWVLNASAGTLVITSNQLRAAYYTADVIYHWETDTFDNNQYAQATFSALAAGVYYYMGLAVRCAAGSTWTEYHFTSGDTDTNVYVAKYVTGTQTILATVASSSFAVNDVARMEANGTTIRVLKNGSEIFSQTEATIASGYAGVAGTAGADGTRIDNWEGGNLVADTIVTPTFIAAGAQTVTLTTGATLSPALPAGWHVGDLLVMIIAGRCNGSTITNTFSNTWSLAGERFREIGAGATDLYIGVYTRIAQSGEASPTVTPDADFLTSGTTGGVSAQIAAYQYASETLDVATAVNDAAAAATWTPPAVTTVNPYALVLSCVATSDDNALNFGGSGAANSFTLAMSGASYDTTTGSDHAVGMAYLVKTTAGAVTMCIWNESAVGNDPWVGVTVAFTIGIPFWTNSLLLNQAMNRSNV